ncbi:MAG: RNA polymerase sigma factor [Myxococcota bacterium]
MGTDPPEDEATKRLLDRLERDDLDAFAELFALHRDDLKQVCRRLVFDASSVDDVLSEIFLRAHRAFPQFNREKPFRPWLRAVAANHCIDRLRRERTERGIFDSGDFAVEAAADHAPDALLGITQREERDAVLRALDSLPTKFRVPLVLRFYKELDYEAIASILGTTRNQVGTLLYRGKARLRAEILAQSAKDATVHEEETR